MKYRHLTALSLLVLSVSADPFAAPGRSDNAIQRDFQVSKVGSDKSELLRVYEAISESTFMEDVKLFDATDFEVTFRISSTEFIVYPKEKISGEKILGKLYLLITETPWEVVRSETISNLQVVNTGKIADLKEYSDRFGGSVRLLREVKLQKITKEEFVSRLRAGETWTLRNFTTEDCRKCMGRGKLGKLDDYALCPECKGKGQFPVDYTVKW